MSDQSDSIKLNKKQVEFLLEITDEDDADVAMRLLAKAMVAEGVSPRKIPEYLNKLMKLEKK